MYGKIFESIYDGSLSENWKTMIVFQQFIILADQDGIVDMTPKAIARRTNIPIQIILEAIKELEKPDGESRSSEEDGRRLIRIDPQRGWGWQLVNYEQYKQLGTHQDKLKADRERIRDKRAMEKGCRKVSQSVASVADVAHIDIDIDIDKRKYIKEKAAEVLAYLNRKKDSRYKRTDEIIARLKDGGTVEDCKKIIDNKFQDSHFIENPQYLNPETLFRKKHWDKYLNENYKPKKRWDEA